MKLLAFLLIFHLYQISSKQYFITSDRSACKNDQSDCDGSQSRPFSNAIQAFKIAVSKENEFWSGILEFFFKNGIHIIHPYDFLEENGSSRALLSSPFNSYEGIVKTIKKKLIPCNLIIIFCLHMDFNQRDAFLHCV